MIPALTKSYGCLPTIEDEQEYRDYVRKINNDPNLTWQEIAELTQKKAEELGL